MSETTVTKSIRITQSEAEELTQVARSAFASEAALMKQWVLDGIQTYKLESAIRAYMERKTDLRSGAAMAGIAYNDFLGEIQKRNIVILEDEFFLDRVGELADAFDNEILRRAVRQAAINPRS